MSNYAVKVTKIPDSWKKLLKQQFEERFPEPPPEPEPIDISKCRTLEEKAQALAQLVQRMPTGFWGENGHVMCDRQL